MLKLTLPIRSTLPAEMVAVSGDKFIFEITSSAPTLLLT